MNERLPAIVSTGSYMVRHNAMLPVRVVVVGTKPVMIGATLLIVSVPVAFAALPTKSFTLIVSGRICPFPLVIPYVARFARDRFQYQFVVVGRDTLFIFPLNPAAPPTNPASASYVFIRSIINPLHSLILYGLANPDSTGLVLSIVKSADRPVLKLSSSYA